MASPVFHSLDLPEDVQDHLEKITAQIHQDWSSVLDGLVLFGSASRGDFIVGRSNINLLVVVRNLTVDFMEGVGRLHRQWGKHQIVAPLLMTAEDLVRSRHLFPLECLQMNQNHVVLAGRDPFGEFPLDTVRLGWQCEQELMANLLRLRQRFIEGEARIEAIQALLILSITAVLPCIRGLLHSLGQPSNGKDMDILEGLPGTLQFDSAIFLEILSIKRGLSSPGSLEWRKVYDRYLQNLERFLKRAEEIREERLQ